MISRNISFIGAGRVAESLCMEFIRRGHVIGSIVTPGMTSGPALAEKCNAKWSPVPRFTGETDIIIVAVPDKSLSAVLGETECSEGTVVAHTAGSFGLEIFPGTIRRYGLFYPLQTFSRGRSLNFREIPFFVDGSDNETEEVLKELARSLGSKTFKSDTEKRRMLHAAAVFVCNFTNFMLTSGKAVSEKAGFTFDILVPLINETITRAIESGPEDSQTGPASRNDYITIEKHLELLSFSPELRKLYEEVTRSIISFYKEKLKDE